MMILVVISYAICMTPVKVKQIIQWFNPKLFQSLHCWHPNVFDWINMSVRWLATLHSVVNPIIYSFMSKNFRVFLNLHFILYSLSNKCGWGYCCSARQLLIIVSASFCLISNKRQSLFVYIGLSSQQ